MAAPLVSVVVPTYNRCRDLARCLDSLRRQTRTDFEVIVCDDGSTDETPAVVDSFASDLDITFDTAANWGGPARPRNRGIALARAPYVAFLDADDWWSPSKLEVSVPPLERGADIVYHHLYLVNTARQRVFLRRVKARDLARPVFRDLVMNANALPLSSVVARRSVLIEIGGMPEDRTIIAMEDYICWLNAAKVTDRFERAPGTHGFYWAAGGNISNDRGTLRLMDLFEGRYDDELAIDRVRMTPWWVTYARARAHYGLGGFRAARRELSLLGEARPPAAVRLKAMWMSAQLAFNRDDENDSLRSSRG